ncbi:molybdopterin-dependent oxidoreductase [uncultured Desulfosarcina sp.]|uniref:molybdopterin-containing oxidoreductase family protein n=1 Tax=uncultured Desulfosarcina sp. TaxID=218289 RepID=UPI0029C6CFF8|nr:molybdopterin-dependent oxidoreductase [uncultured Desulfosarcina sp.]
MKIIKTVCHRDCPDTCFMDVTVDRGKIIAIRGSTENPVTGGFLCPRGNGDPQRVYSKNRVLHPHVKAESGESGTFSRVSWDAALSTVSGRIQATLDTHGRESLLLYDYPGNTGFLAWHFAKRLWSALGATTSDYTLCSSSGHAGIGLHYGLSYGLQLEDMAASTVILFWGNNARVSASHIWAMASHAKKNQGAILVCVDPRKSPTAEAADIWVQPIPGSDVALCYGIARYLIEKGGVDLGFIGRWTTGFPKYAETAMEWTPQRVEQVSGVPGHCVAQIGELLMTHRPAAFMIGLGLQKSMQGAEAARAVALLPALLGLHRGFQYSNARGPVINWPTINGGGLSGHRGKVVSQVAIGERLAGGEFKFVYVLGSNPAMTLPDQSAVRRGLDRKDVFVVVQDTHWSETALRADVVLPAPTYLEKRDVTISDHHPFSRLSEKAIEPLGDSRHEIWVMQQLAKRLGLTADWLYEDPWASLEKTLARTYQEGGLKNILDGEILEVKLKPNEAYQTPSGKIEFAASVSPAGATPLPTQQPLPSADSGLILLNSSTAKFTHSQFTDVYGPIPQVVWVNPEDAGQRSIEENDRVAVFNELATVTLHAKVTAKVPSGTLWAPRPLTGLNGVPLNALVPGISQGIGGGPIFNSVKVKIRLAAGSSESDPSDHSRASKETYRV